MMKKLLAALLSASLLLSMAGCGSKPNPDIISSSGVMELFNEDDTSTEYDPEEPDASEESSSGASSAAPEPPASASQAQPKPSSQPAKPPEPPAPSSRPTPPPKPQEQTRPPAPSSKPAPPPAPDPVPSQPPKKPVDTTSPSEAPMDEMRAIWISYLDFNTLLKNKTENQFRRNINTAFGKIEALGLNTVIVQVRPFGDALYPSNIFPWSHTITGTEGEDPEFDPLDIICETADVYDLRVEAWVNPYRIRNKNTKAPLSDDNLALEWLEEESGEVIRYDGGIYFNPGNEYARDLIVSGVEEIVENYPVDGIHFDDYFYPTTDAAFDAETYAQYRDEGGRLSLADWRRENVDLLVSATYSAIKDIDRDVRFGVSPQGNNENNYNSQYIDVKHWLTQEGFVDYICPQIYFGFENSSYPFAETVRDWNSMIRLKNVDLYVGIAPYKLGREDAWAGSGKNEWKNTTDILARMVKQARRSSHYQGFALFRYDSVFNPDSSVKAQVHQERENLQSILD